MRIEDKEKFLKDFWGLVYKRGMPVNVRQGLNSEIADWAVDIAEDCIELDTPSGVMVDDGKDRCPKCKKTAGTSGFFCKYCGNMLREVLF